MKKRLSLLFLIVSLIFPAFSLSQQVARNAFDDRDFQVQYSFKGEWIPDEDPLKIGPENFADLQNWRYTDTGIDGVRGYDNINTTVLSGTSLKIRSGIQLYSPYDTSYLLFQSYDTGLTSSQVIENRTTPPSQGNFQATPIHTDSSGANLGRFASAPGGQIAYTNQVDSMIYGGDESPIAAFFTSGATITGGTLTNPRDYTRQVQNTLQTASNVAIIGGGNDSYTKLLLHADGADESTTFTDSASGSTTHTVTAEGDAEIDTAQKKFGQGSGLFSGTSDFLTVPDHADWNFADGAFTIDFWLRLNTTTENSGIYGQWTDSDNYSAINFTYSAGARNLKFFITIGGSAEVNLNYLWTSSVAANTWYHIAIIRGWSGNANDWALCIDGVAVDTDTSNSTTYPDYATVATIGGYGDTTGTVVDLNGWLDEFRISKGIARWQTTFSPPARAYSTDATDWLIGSTRPLEGVKYYIADGNSTSGTTLSAKEWNGSDWDSLSITDNTSSLSTTGTVTWASTSTTSKPRYINDLYLYWYNFNLTDGEATIYHVSADKGFSPIVDIWDGIPRECIQFQVERSAVYEDYTLEVNASTESAEYTFAATIGGMTSSDHIIAMFDDRTTAIRWEMIGTKTNTASGTTIDIYFWGGDDWVEVSNLNDLTKYSSSGTSSLAQTGVMSWSPPDESEEFERTLFGVTGYAYKITTDGTLTNGTKANVSVDRVYGIPAQQQILGYKFPFMYKERLFLCNSIDTKEGNRCDYSAKYSPDVWNGEDTSDYGQSLYFGGNEELTAGTQIYNRFGSAIYNTGLLLKANSTYTLDGDSPEDFQIKTVSTSIGCPAPLTLATAETAYAMTEEIVRNIAIWMSFKGPMIFDGSVIAPIPGVRKYFDPEKPTCINYDAIQNARAWFDPGYMEYNLLIPSGSGQTTNNIWLTYDLERKKWFRKVPVTYPQFAMQAIDQYGTVYTYGTLDTGYLERLEYGATWDGTNISYVVKTADVIPTGNVWDESLVRQFKIISQMPDLDEGETVTISTKHYVNGNRELYDTLDNFEIDPANYIHPYYLITDDDYYVMTDNDEYIILELLEAVRWVRSTQDVNLRGISHQFEFTLTSNDYSFVENFGKRLIGWGMEGRVVRRDIWQEG